MALRPERNILSLCAGVGGLELGIQLALDYRGEAGRLICAVEREAAAAASLVASMEAGWFHPAPVWSDMLTFDARPWRGLVHILASGDPCQDNSVAGKRAGADGERFLAPEVCRLAAECRPDLIFRENVPGNADGQLAAIVPALEGLGYRVAAGIFSSYGTGNTMRRERLFIMAQRQDEPWRMGARSEWQHLPDAGGCCGALGNPMRKGSFPRTHQGIHQGEESPGPRDAQPDGRGGIVGSPVSCSSGWNSDDAERGSIERTSSDRAGRAVEQAHDMARPSSPRPQGSELGSTFGSQFRLNAPRPTAELRGALLPPAVIPGPTDSRWIDVLDRFPELQPALSQEEAESHLRRGIDALAHRVERLRATGNGVDPVAAATAFLSLRALLDA